MSGTYSYTIGRQYATLAAWENCVDGGPCAYFPVASASLVADDRREVGVAYEDSVFTTEVAIDGSHRRQPHDHADGGRIQPALRQGRPGRRHRRRGDRRVGGARARRLRDGRVAGAPEHGRLLRGHRRGAPSAAANNVVLRNNLIHDTGSSAIQRLRPRRDRRHHRATSPTASAARPASGSTSAPPGRVRPGSASSTTAVFGGPSTRRLLGRRAPTPRCCCATTSPTATAGGPSRSRAPRPASSRRTWPATGPGPRTARPGAASTTCPLTGAPGVNFVNTTSGTEGPAHPGRERRARNAGADLSAIFNRDVDYEVRPTGAGTVGHRGGRVPGLHGGQLRLVHGPGGSSRRSSSSGRRRRSWTTWASICTGAFPPDGPWVRPNASLIPGLGSSPEGKSYRYVESRLRERDNVLLPAGGPGPQGPDHLARPRLGDAGGRGFPSRGTAKDPPSRGRRRRRGRRPLRRGRRTATRRSKEPCASSSGRRRASPSSS